MQSDKNVNQNEGSFPVVSFARKKKKESIKSARRLFLAAWGLCQGTDFSLSSQFLPGPFLVCSPFFFLPFFFLSPFIWALSVWEAICREPKGPACAGSGNRGDWLPVDGDTRPLGWSRETPLFSQMRSCQSHTQTPCCFFYHLPCRFIPIAFFLNFPPAQDPSFGCKMRLPEAACSHSLPSFVFDKAHLCGSAHPRMAISLTSLSSCMTLMSL